MGLGLGLDLSGLKGLRVQKVRKAPLVPMVLIRRCQALKVHKGRLVLMVLRGQRAQIPRCRALKGKPA